jgi:hypothetical protein
MDDFLTTFDTTLLIDDSGSMAGRGWREVSQELAIIAPIVSAHDDDGLDLYFSSSRELLPSPKSSRESDHKAELLLVSESTIS